MSVRILGLPVWEWVALAFIFLFSFLLRFPGLETNPPGFFRDEVEKGYTAYELSETWRHAIQGPKGVELSPRLPAFIEVYEAHDKTSAIYQYLSIPFIKIGGLSIYTTRLLAAVSGFVMVILVWVFMRRYFGGSVAIVSSAVMAFQPTGILFSRWAQQGVVMMVFTLLGMVFLFEGTNRQEGRNQRVMICLGALFFGLAAYAYAPARVVAFLLFVGVYLLSDWKRVWKKKNIHLMAMIVFLFIWIHLLVFTLTIGSARLEHVGLFQEGFLGGIVLFFQNYVAHFNPMFLFVTGDANPRHTMPGYGVAHWGTALLLIMALAAIIYRVYMKGWREARVELYLVFFLLSAPCAAALTKEGIPHASRANLMVPAIALLSGLSVRWECLKTLKLCYVVTGVVVIFNGVMAFRALSLLAESSPIPWEGGIQQAMKEALSRKGKVYLGTDIPYANYVILFTEKTPPADYHRIGKQACESDIIMAHDFSRLEEGDCLISKPHPGISLEYTNEFVLLYTCFNGSLIFQRPSSFTDPEAE